MPAFNQSQYRLRKAIGLLGIILPVLLLLGHDELLSSMSHYYYTSSSIFFIGILTSFGLILYTYNGYPMDKTKKEIISDDLITSLAAICIFITVLVPTQSDGAMGKLDFTDQPYLFGHESNPVKGSIHLISAGLFLVLLGYMSFAKFVLSDRDSDKMKLFYKTCGVIIWCSVGLLILLFIVDAYFVDGDLNCYIPGYTFWLEMIAVWAFGIAWLVKGKIQNDFNRAAFKQKPKTKEEKE